MTPDDRARNLAILDQLRQAARRRGAQTPPPEGVVEYDWTRPYHFAPAQRAVLADVAGRAAARVGEALGALLRTDLKFEAAEPVECYASAADEADAYGVALHDASGSACGVIRLPAATALAWVGGLLGGGAASAGEGGELSSLETVLLLDLAAAMTQALSAVIQQSGGPALRHGDALTTLARALPDAEGAELCRFTFRAGSGDAAREFALLLRSAVLDPVAAPGRRARTGQSAERIRARLAARVEAVTVSATAHLGVATISVQDLMSLEPGDVVVLDCRARGLIAVSVDGQPVLEGLPALCRGRYAVQVPDLRRFPRLSLAVAPDEPED
ncbi:MAG: FliM/FliN family flagellar motor switch protein [Planctomycetes bacterium]|nr:FliM/FliN family flagellar motor switch protein [Planctomycetota bacterium]